MGIEQTEVDNVLIKYNFFTKNSNWYFYKELKFLLSDKIFIKHSFIQNNKLYIHYLLNNEDKSIYFDIKTQTISDNIPEDIDFIFSMYSFDKNNIIRINNNRIYTTLDK